MAAKKEEPASAGVIEKLQVPPALAPGASDVAQFEAALNELEQIVARLERGELKLEESLQLFERGVALARQCRSSLESAELRVKHLLAERAADEP